MKSPSNSTTPNTANTAKMDKVNKGKNPVKKLPLDQVQPHMNDIIKNGENESRDPLMFRFRKIVNLKVRLFFLPPAHSYLGLSRKQQI